MAWILDQFNCLQQKYYGSLGTMHMSKTWHKVENGSVGVE